MYLHEIRKTVQGLNDALAAACLTNQEVQRQEIPPEHEGELEAATGFLMALASKVTEDICSRLIEVNCLLASLVETEAALKILGVDMLNPLDDAYLKIIGALRNNKNRDNIARDYFNYK